MFIHTILNNNVLSNLRGFNRSEIWRRSFSRSMGKICLKNLFFCLKIRTFDDKAILH